MMYFLKDTKNYKLCGICIYIDDKFEKCLWGFELHKYKTENNNVNLWKKNCKKFKVCNAKQLIKLWRFKDKLKIKDDWEKILGNIG